MALSLHIIALSLPHKVAALSTTDSCKKFSESIAESQPILTINEKEIKENLKIE